MTTQTIDLTPTWRGILPVLIALIEKGNAEGRKAAVDDLERMATIADTYVKQQKEKTA
jgi:hypothetical protein